MIPNCKGCVEELYQAYEYQREGLHLATSINNKGIERKGHLFIVMVDDKGKIMVR